MDTTLDALDDYIAANKQQFTTMLQTLVNVPTVSTDPAHAADIAAGVELAANYLRDAGFITHSISTEGNPVVYGELIQDSTYPTVLLYNHLDVQPADKKEWNTDPFSLTITDDKFYGRGATDDKGPAMTALLAIRYAIAHHVPLNFKVAWEFEEEIGSPHFDAFARSHKDLLQADSMVVVDTIWLSADRPTIDYGLRGLMRFEVSLQTAGHDTHSGLTGGVARNPIGELSQIISECYDAVTGEVKIPGFYDEVAAASAMEMQDFINSGFDVEEYAKDHDLHKLRTHDLREVVTRIMVQPTFEVHGITGGYDGPGIKTIIPHQATAKLSTRLVPHQDPRVVFDRIKDFILSKHPDVTVRLDSAALPYLGQFEGPYADAARKASLYAFGKAPVFIREGGTIGAVISLSQVVNAPIMLMGLSLPEHGYHAVNEYFDWKQASGGIKLFVKYFAEIAQIKQY